MQVNKFNQFLQFDSKKLLVDVPSAFSLKTQLEQVIL